MSDAADPQKPRHVHRMPVRVRCPESDSMGRLHHSVNLVYFEQGRTEYMRERGETPADWRNSLYYHYYDPGCGMTKHYGVRTERFTPAHFYPVKEWELFDNEKDPLQLRNVYADPAYAKTVDELKAELERLRQQSEPGFDPQAAQGQIMVNAEWGNNRSRGGVS